MNVVGEEAEATDMNTVVFKLDVTCLSPDSNKETHSSGMFSNKTIN